MPVSFTKVKLPFGWLGNMAAFPIQWDGREWRTAEALFQALRFDDDAIRELIRLQRSPMGAKMMAKTYADKMTVIPMSTADLSLMDFVIRLKIKQHPQLQTDLLATGNEVIIEDVTARATGGRHTFWGMARDRSSGEWVGENALGNIWMKIREELRNGSFASPTTATA